jgi:phosphoribosylaminoimidazole-succinocarboxamide synthase
MQNFPIFDIHDQQEYYKGKVRDVYSIEDKIVLIATNRISAFDHILPAPIPYKGQVLNQIAAYFLNATADIVPNWLEATPHPHVSIGKRCQPVPIEMVVRGYLAGHAAREYASGKRSICGVILPDGLKEGDILPQPIITPTTKAAEGHDQDISKEEILSSAIVESDLYEMMEKYALALFQRGTSMAASQDLILVDTKYEFGLFKGEIMLMDEVHTPDSSRYYIKSSYSERKKADLPQIQLSKEFVREWLMEHGFQGKDGQIIPELPSDFILEISERYIELFQRITGKQFEPSDEPINIDIIKRFF